MARDRTNTSIGQEEAQALEQARRRAPDQDPSVAAFGEDVESYDTQSVTEDDADATARDWAVAESARPDMSDETADGLNDVEEEVRRMAEDLPVDETLDERIRRKAYELWESEGGPHGRAEDHWHIAAEIVAEEDASRSALLPFESGSDEPVAEASIQDNLGEFPSLTDQGEQIDERGQSGDRIARDLP